LEQKKQYNEFFIMAKDENKNERIIIKNIDIEFRTLDALLE